MIYPLRVQQVETIVVANNNIAVAADVQATYFIAVQVVGGGEMLKPFAIQAKKPVLVRTEPDFAFLVFRNAVNSFRWDAVSAGIRPYFSLLQYPQPVAICPKPDTTFAVSKNLVNITAAEC